MTTPGGELRATVERVARQAEKVRDAASQAARDALARQAAQAEAERGGTDAASSARP